MEGGFPVGSSDWHSILQMLKDEDEMLVYQGAMELRDSLSYAQENQMQGFPTDQLIEILVKIVTREALTDLSSEVKFFAIQCLTTLMDIFPNLINALVSAGLVAGLNSVMQTSFGFIDLAEACVKAFEKIVTVNPVIVLKSGTVGTILQQIDFFEVATQQRIFRIIERIARHSQSESDFDQFMVPIIPFLVMNLSSDFGATADNKKLEDISRIIFEIQESFFLFNQFTEQEKIGILYEKLLDLGLFEVILKQINIYCKTNLRQMLVKYRNLTVDPLFKDFVNSENENLLQYENQISSNKQSQNLSQQTLVNFLKIIQNACSYSINVSNRIFADSYFVSDLAVLLPSEYINTGAQNSYNQDEFPFINEVINVSNALLSEKQTFEQTAENKPEPVEGQKNESSSLIKDEDNQEEEQNDQIMNEIEKQIFVKQEFENKKRKFQKSSENKKKIENLADYFLPRLFFVHENISVPQFRTQTLQLIDKILDLFDDQLLRRAVEPNQFAKFIYQILRTKQFSSIEVCLQITKKILDCSPISYAIQLIREGVSAQIDNLSTAEKFKITFGIKSDIDICDSTFDLEIYQIKEALHRTKTLTPEDYQTKDFYERRLLELVEKQKQGQQLDYVKFKKKNSELKLTKVGQDKSEIFEPNFGQIKCRANHPLNFQRGVPKKYSGETLCDECRQPGLQKKEFFFHCPLCRYDLCQKCFSDKGGWASAGFSKINKNCLPEIFKFCEGLQNDYFLNKEFIQKLQEQSIISKRQLNIFQELCQLAKNLSLEATNNHENFEEAAQGNLKNLLFDIAKLFTELEFQVTNHEFKGSNLLFSFELLLTKTPSQAKQILNKNSIFDKDEEMKSSEEDKVVQQNKMQVSKNEACSLINRFKIFSHVFLTTKNKNQQSGKSLTAMQILIEANQRIISENDSILLNIPQNAFLTQEFRSHQIFGQQNPGINGRLQSQGLIADYEHCINALRQLQKRVTINLIYDPQKVQINNSKTNQNLKTDQTQYQDFLNTPQQTEQINQTLNNQIQLNISENHSPQANNQIVQNFQKQQISNENSETQVRDDNNIDKNNNFNEELPKPKQMKTSFSAEPNFQGLAGSSSNEKLDSIQKEFEKQQIQMSKVYLKRHHLYNELKQIPVTVEQTSCIQILEDFLRNRIKTMENVKELKQDYGIPPQSMINQFMGRPQVFKKEKKNGQPNLLEQAYKSQSSSITQKIVLTKMTNQSRKLLDKISSKLVQILSDNNNFIKPKKNRALKLFQDKNKGTKRIRTNEEDKDLIMEDSKEEKPLNSDEAHQKQDVADISDEDYDQEMHMEHGEEEEEEETLQEEMIRDEAIESFINETANEIKNQIPADQQSLFMKALSRQHIPMLNFLETRQEELKQEQGKEDLIYELQQNIGEFQDIFLAVTDLFKQIDSNQKSQQKPEEDHEMTEQESEEQIKRQDELIQEEEDRLNGLIQASKQRTENQVGIIEEPVSEQTQEVLVHDLEELIRQQGEDIDFEFFFEGKSIQLSQTLFEIIKEAEKKRIKQEVIHQRSEQVKFIQQKEQEISRKAQLLAETGQTDQSETQEKIFRLKREAEALKDILAQIQKEIKGPDAPHYSFFSALSHAHKIYFCIKDKTIDARPRMDSLIEFRDSPAKRTRSRTKSEFVQDVSSANINEFVLQIIQQEFKVFDEDDYLNQAALQKILTDEQENGSTSQETQYKTSDRLEQQKLQQSLKLLKVINFLYSHTDIITSKGLNLIMKQDFQLPQLHPITFSDLELQIGFTQLNPILFQNPKLDSYLQRSIKDPYTLVQGVSSQVQSIFLNCPFLFPFSTKQMYFKLVSFISAIDVHRSIFFLRQYIKQQAGSSYNQKYQANEKDNLKKIAKQKATVQRDKIVQSAFTVISKIDKRSFLELEFAGEEGTGLGPTLEFYDNIAEEFKKWSLKIAENVSASNFEFKMWRMTQDNYLFPSPLTLKSIDFEVTKQIYEIFRLCGTIIAKAIVDDRQIDLPISPLFWKLCMGAQTTIYDLKSIDIQIYETMVEFQIIANKVFEIEKKYEIEFNEEMKQKELSLLVSSKGASIDDYGFVFTLPGFDQIELIEDGKNKSLTLDNVQDFIDLVLHQTFHESIKMQVQAFKKGFNAIFPISSLKPFTLSSSTEEELEKIVCGVSSRDPEWENREELIRNIQPDHGFSRNSVQYINFIRYIMELSHENRPQFIKFLTGSKRLPLGGFKSLQPNLTFVLKKGENVDFVLPSVMACQNYLKCPTYSSYEVMKRQFDFAVKEGQQNFTLS